MCARRLAEAGVRVAMIARTERTLALAAASTGAAPIAADVTDADAVRALPDRLETALGDRVPDILVNAAGAFTLAPIAETSPESFDAQLAANLRGPFLMIRAFLPGMLARGSGHIVTLGSVAGRQAFPMNGAYSASKYGVRGLHAVLDAELKGTGVRSTLVEPAATDTALWDAIDRSRFPGLPERDAMLAPEHVADAILFALTRPADLAVREIFLERT